MWYPLHFLTIPLGYLTVFFVAFFSRRLSPRARTWAVRTFVILLYVGEVIKQITVRGSYSPNYLPFHYSSTYYISFALFAFGRDRVRHYGACASYVGGLFLLVTMTINPHSVVGDPAMMFTHYYHAYSYFYHMAVLLLWAVMLMNGEYRMQRFDYLRYLTFLGAWAAAAIPAAFLLDVNYAGILRSFIHPLELIRLRFGQVVYLLTYGVFALVGVWIAFLLYRLGARIIAAARERKDKDNLPVGEN